MPVRQEQLKLQVKKFGTAESNSRHTAGCCKDPREILITDCITTTVLEVCLAGTFLMLQGD